jgi:hypothetical protein
MAAPREQRTRQATYILCNIEERSCNHCRSGKAISITYSECMFVALGIQYAMRMWPVPLNYIFPHYLLNGTIFRIKVTKHKMCVLIFSTNFA